MPTKDLSPARLVTFTVNQNYSYAASPARVFEALTTDIGFWWDRRYMREAGLDIELHPDAGGLMQQSLDGGGQFVMAQVQEVRPNRVLALTGTFGIPGAVYGSVRFELIPNDSSGTNLSIEHLVIGDLTLELEGIFDNGWALLLNENLRTYVEHNKKPGVRAA